MTQQTTAIQSPLKNRFTSWLDRIKAPKSTVAPLGPAPSSQTSIQPLEPIAQALTPEQQKAKKREELIASMPDGIDDFSKGKLLEIVEQVEELSDTENGIEVKAQGAWISAVAIAAPIITAFVLAYETGAFFYKGDFNPASMLSWVQFGVAFLLEAVLVGVVFEMAKAKKNGDKSKWRSLFGFWIFFIICSYVGQFAYLYSTYTVQGQGHGVDLLTIVGILLRCGACCLIDLVCSGYLGSKAKTLEKQVKDLGFKSKAIKDLTIAQIELTEAIIGSVQRRKEEDARVAQRQAEDEQTARFKAMIVEAGLTAMQSPKIVEDTSKRGMY